MIHWELCKKIKFDHTNKWYIHNPESVLDNETHKVLLDFLIQTDHLISARCPDLVIIKKRTCRIVDFAVPAHHRVKLKESETRDKNLHLTREVKITMVTVIPTVIGALGTILKGLVLRTSGDHPDNGIIKIGPNTEMSIRDLRSDLLSLKLQWQIVN